MKLLIPTLLFTFYSFGQTLLQKNVDKFIGVDVYENYYYLKDGSFFKSNLKNDYKNINYGLPNSIDISNPLEILVFYKFFNKVVLLDNQLNFISEFNLPVGTDMIANAGKDKVWIYSNINNSLSIYKLSTRKQIAKSVSNTHNIIYLKGNLNQATTLTNQQELITFNFLARIIKTDKINKSTFPISLHKPYFIKDCNLWYKDKIILKNTPTLQMFEVVNDNLYFLEQNQIYRISIPKN